MTKTEILNKYRAKRDELREELDTIKGWQRQKTGGWKRVSGTWARQDRIRCELAIYEGFVADLEAMRPIDTACSFHDCLINGVNDEDA